MTDRAALIEQAWTQIEGVLQTGILVTGDGKQRALHPGELATMVRWVASLDSGKKKRALSLPEDLRHLLESP